MTGQHRALMHPADAEFLEQVADNAPAIVMFGVVPLAAPVVAVARWFAEAVIAPVFVQTPVLVRAVPAWVWLAVTLAALAAGTAAHLIDRKTSS